MLENSKTDRHWFVGGFGQFAQWMKSITSMRRIGTVDVGIEVIQPNRCEIGLDKIDNKIIPPTTKK
jgi:hypothetical protein